MKCTKFDIQQYTLPQASQPSGTVLELLEEMNRFLLASKFSWSRNYTEQTYIKFHLMNSNWNRINFLLPLLYFSPSTYWKCFCLKILPKTLIFYFHNIHDPKIIWMLIIHMWHQLHSCFLSIKQWGETAVFEKTENKVARWVSICSIYPFLIRHDLIR